MCKMCLPRSPTACQPPARVVSTALVQALRHARFCSFDTLLPHSHAECAASTKSRPPHVFMRLLM